MVSKQAIAKQQNGGKPQGKGGVHKPAQKGGKPPVKVAAPVVPAKGKPQQVQKKNGKPAPVAVVAAPQKGKGGKKAPAKVVAAPVEESEDDDDEDEDDEDDDEEESDIEGESADEAAESDEDEEESEAEVAAPVKAAKKEAAAPAKKVKAELAPAKVEPAKTEMAPRDKTADSRTLFVKNLPENTTEEELKGLSTEITEIRIKEAKKPNGKNKALGKKFQFAYLEFKDEATCVSCYKSLQHSKIRGKELVIDYVDERSAYAKKEEKKVAEKVKDVKRIHIGGFDKTASEAELKKLFSGSTEFTLPIKKDTKLNMEIGRAHV